MAARVFALGVSALLLTAAAAEEMATTMTTTTCAADACQPVATILDHTDASSIVVDTTNFEAAGLEVEIVAMTVEEARTATVGGTYAAPWRDDAPCPYLAVLPLEMGRDEGCCGYWCGYEGAEECAGRLGRRVAAAPSGGGAPPACEDDGASVAGVSFFVP